MIPSAALIRRRLLSLSGRGFDFGDRSWRSLASQTPPPPPISSRIPWLMVSSANNPDSRCFYKLTKDDKHHLFNFVAADLELSFPNTIMAGGRQLIGSSHGFLFSVSALPPTFDIRGVNPLTGACLHLPPATLTDIKENIKLILSPSLDKAVLLHLGTRKAEAEFTSLPASTASWTPLPFSKHMYGLQDCIFHKGRLFVIDSCGSITIFDDHFFDNPSSPSPIFWNTLYYLPQEYLDKIALIHILLESPCGDDLYLLFQYKIISCYRRFYNETTHFKVRKLDEDDHKEVKSIGDLAMFVGRDNATSLHASHFPILEPNAIYFTDSSFSEHKRRSAGNILYDTGVYHLKDGTVEMFDLSVKRDQITNSPPPMWFKPAAF